MNDDPNTKSAGEERWKGTCTVGHPLRPCQFRGFEGGNSTKEKRLRI